MTRFRAYATDSEDGSDDTSGSGSSSEPERNFRADQDDEESDSGESMVEEELLKVAPRNRDRRLVTRDLEDEEEEDDDDDDDDEDLPSDEENDAPMRAVSARKGPLPSSNLRHNSHIIPRARELGIDPQKMHVMQTSFFRMPEEEAAMKAAAQPSSRQKLRLPLQLSRKHSRDSEGDGLRSESRQRASFDQDLEPAPYRPSRKYARVESSASVATGSEHAFVDAGLAFGRSFRVGWGPSGTLVHVGQLCGPHSKPDTTANTSVVCKTTVPLLARPHAEASEAALKLLSHHLLWTPIAPDADGIPFANPPGSFSFSTMLSQFPASDNSFEANLFRLGHALFDPIDLRLPDGAPTDVRNRIYNLRRKRDLSTWLEGSVSSAIQAELRDNPGANWAPDVFTLLTGNQIEKACDFAMDSGNVKLASLIAQCPGDEEYKTDLQAQLALWRDQHIDAHIGESVRKIYALLAGTVHVLEGSNGSGVEQCPDVDVSKGLSWKRAFGLHLWFGEMMDTPVASVFQAYNGLWKEPASGVAPPRPWYAEEGLGQSPWKLPSSADPPDALFSLIELFSDQSCSLSNILSPLSFSASPVDYRLPWHLYIILSRCLRIRDLADRQSLGFLSDVESQISGDDDTSVEGHSPSADLMANSYALQLEQAGMVQEAVFVLLHIEGSAGRQKAVRELLGRNAALLDDWMTRGLVGSLKLPMAWVNEAKAMYALNNGDVFAAYELYCTAGLWNAAHDLAVLELAPDAVLRHDLDLLKSLFEPFEGHAVDEWEFRGQVFVEYARAMTRLPELRELVADGSVAVDPALTSEINQIARNVPRLIRILPDVLRDRTDMRHNAALLEMTTGLQMRMDQVGLRGGVSAAEVRSAPLSDAAKLRHMQSMIYTDFISMIEEAQ